MLRAQGSLLFSLGKDKYSQRIETGAGGNLTPDSWGGGYVPRYISAKERKNSFQTDENYEDINLF